MTVLAKKNEVDYFAKLREVFPTSQKTIDAMQKAIELDRGEPLKVWAELESYQHANICFFRCEYSRWGEPVRISMQAEID